MADVIYKDILESKSKDYMSILEETERNVQGKELKIAIFQVKKSLLVLLSACNQTIESKKIETKQESGQYWSIEKLQHWTRIVCDMRIPHRTMDKKQYALYRMSIEDVMEEHFQKDKHIKKCFMVFVHHHKSKQCKDADNFEEKPLSDMISDYFIIGGDGYDNVQRMTLTKKDIYNFTEIYLVPYENFLRWYQWYEKTP